MMDWRFAVVITMLSGTVILSGTSERRLPQSLARPLESIPTEMSQWHTVDRETLGAEVLKVLKPTSYISRFYKGSADALGLFIAFYERQTAGATLHSPKNCLPGSGWEIWRQGSLTIPSGSSNTVVNRYSVRRGDDKMVIYYWYQSKDRIVASEVAGKFFLVKDSLISGNTAAALVRLTLPDTPASDDHAAAFARSLIPEIQACFGK
jgi:EpsI family protein